MHYPDKINDEKILSNVEAMNLVMIPRMFKENNSEVLEKVCFLLQNLKIEDEEFHLELIFEMDCMIHKYAETLDDIKRLEEVIGLRKAMTSREYQNKLIFKKGESQGRSQGLSQGEFSMALKIKEALGIDEAVRISGFSKEDLLNGKLSNENTK